MYKRPTRRDQHAKEQLNKRVVYDEKITSRYSGGRLLVRLGTMQ